MENTQSVQQPSAVPVEAPETQLEAPKTTNSEVQSKIGEDDQVNQTNLLAKHPWLLLVGVLAIFMSSAAIALYSLYSLNYAERTEQVDPEAIANIQQPEAELSVTASGNTSSNSISLWMILAIAFSCASGCWIIFRCLNRPVQKKVLKNAKPRPTKRQRRFPQLELPPAKNLPVFVPPSKRKSVANKTEEESQPVVTVLPPEENTNSDNQESLASIMDIRKQTSLSNLLRK